MFGIHEWIYGSLLLLNGKAYICPDKAAAWNMTRYEVIPKQSVSSWDYTTEVVENLRGRHSGTHLLSL